MTCVIGMGTVKIKFVSVIRVIKEITVKINIVDIKDFVTIMENALIINVYVMMGGVVWNVKVRHVKLLQIVIIKEHVLMDYASVIKALEDSIVNGISVVIRVYVAVMVSAIKIRKTTIVNVMMLIADINVSI
jgi:hypothetical protein